MVQQNNSTIDPERLEALANLANEIGAEGIWLIRGAVEASLIYTPGNPQPPKIAGVAILTYNLSINLEIADTCVLVIMRFPSDGKEPGI